MKHTITFLAVIMMAMISWDVHAQYGYVDFSAESPSGHTLYYKGASWGIATVVPQNNIYYGYESAYTNLSGNVVIPDSVEHNGVIYMPFKNVLKSQESRFQEVSLPWTFMHFGIVQD